VFDAQPPCTVLFGRHKARRVTRYFDRVVRVRKPLYGSSRADSDVRRELAAGPTRCDTTEPVTEAVARFGRSLMLNIPDALDIGYFL